MKAKSRNSELVYSTGTGDVRGENSRGRRDARRGGTERAAGPVAPADGIVRVGRETKGRKGKGVTILTGLPVRGQELEALARELKALCGAGGTVRDGGVVEIQGDHRDRIVRALEDRGWRVKRSGG